MNDFDTNLPESYYQNVIRSIRSLILVIDPEGALLYANLSAQELFCLKQETAGRHYQTFLSAELTDSFTDSCRQVKSHKKEVRVDKISVVIAQKLRVIGYMAFPLFGTGEEITGVVFLGKDITDRVAKEKLRLLYEYTLKSIGSGILILGVDSDVLYLNQTGGTIYGVTVESVQGHFYEKVFPSVVAGSLKETIEAIKQNPGTIRVDRLYTGEIYLGYTAFPVMEPGSDQIIGIVFTGRDISSIVREEKRKEQYIRQVGYIAQAAEYLETGELKTDQMDIVTHRKDELGHLAKTFKKMAEEVIAREKRLHEQMDQLHAFISDTIVDESKAKKQVDEIAESDFFKTLQTRGEELRKRASAPH